MGCVDLTLLLSAVLKTQPTTQKRHIGHRETWEFYGEMDDAAISTSGLLGAARTRLSTRQGSLVIVITSALPCGMLTRSDKKNLIVL